MRSSNACDILGNKGNDVDYWVGRDGQQHGPYNETDLRSLVRTGQIDANDLMWHEGQEGWIPLSTLFEVSCPPAKGHIPVQIQVEDAPPAEIETDSPSAHAGSRPNYGAGPETSPVPHAGSNGKFFARKLPVIEMVLLLGVGLLTIVGLAMFSSHSSQTAATSAAAASYRPLADPFNEYCMKWVSGLNKIGESYGANGDSSRHQESICSCVSEDLDRLGPKNLQEKKDMFDGRMEFEITECEKTVNR